MPATLDIDAIRADFPILSRQVYGKPLVYLDNAATTQKPRCVLQAIEQAYATQNANVHRGVHYLSQQATTAHEAARVAVQRFLHAEHSDEIIFTRGTTESINLVAFSFGEAFCQAGDELIVSEMEHHSNIVPWQMLCQRKGLSLRVIPFNEQGELDLDAFRTLLNERVKLVAVTHMSNVLGTINPIREIVQEAHAAGVPVLVDGAQSSPHLPIDVQSLDVDFYAFSAHKIYGPTGVGVLYGKRRWLNAMPPYQGGGEMIAQVRFDQTTYNELPYKFEAGTPDFIGTTALHKALDYVSEITLTKIAEHESRLLDYATEALSSLPGMTIYGKSPSKGAVLSFNLHPIHPYDLGMLLDKLGIAIRTGHHCAQPLLEKLGVEACARISFSFYNTFDEIDRLVQAIHRIQKMF